MIANIISLNYVSDKKVFGVPFLLLLQRTGETLPKSIQSALKWLKLNAMDQVIKFIFHFMGSNFIET